MKKTCIFLNKESNVCNYIKNSGHGIDMVDCDGLDDKRRCPLWRKSG